MKSRVCAEKAARTPCAETSAAALAPPTYGIGFVDSPTAAPAIQRGAAPIQRLIVNVGEDDFSTELSKKEGWIVGSDMDIAYREGGDEQNVRELGALDNYGKVGKQENIYLEGHGSPGDLGARDPNAVADTLRDLLPKGYKGIIRSHNCSAGVGTRKKGSGVQVLSELLQGVTVQGAAGVALNHWVYYNETTKGTRAFVDKTPEQKRIDKEIDKTRDPVDQAWTKYVKDQGGTIGPDGYRVGADKATEVSSEFYEKLAVTVDDALIRPDETLVTARTTDDSKSSCCFITTACVRARGLPDDCMELTTLRAFRDEHIAPMPNGKEMLKVYYKNSPLILQAINRHPDAAEIYDRLYGVICECVREIQEAEYETAFRTYVEMVIKLRNRFAPSAEIPAFFSEQALEPFGGSTNSTRAT